MPDLRMFSLDRKDRGPRPWCAAELPWQHNRLTSRTDTECPSRKLAEAGSISMEVRGSSHHQLKLVASADRLKPTKACPGSRLLKPTMGHAALGSAETSSGPVRGLARIIRSRKRLQSRCSRMATGGMAMAVRIAMQSAKEGSRGCPARTIRGVAVLAHPRLSVGSGASARISKSAQCRSRVAMRSSASAVDDRFEPAFYALVVQSLWNVPGLSMRS